MRTIRNFAARRNTEQSVKTVTNVPGPKCYQRARLQKALTQVQASSDAHQSLAVLVRDQDGTLVGGLTGRTFLSWFLVDLFWLPESLRGGGLGTRIMAQAEAEAVRRGCIGAHLNTFSFQAPSFYRRLGYEVFGALDDYPPGHKRVFMCKRFGTTVPEGHR